MEHQTKKCHHCGEEILAVAKKCKHCGEWLEHQPVKKSNDVSQEKTNETETDRLIAKHLAKREAQDDFWGCLFWIVIIGGLIWAYNDKPSEEEICQTILEDVRDCIADQTSSTLGFFDDSGVLGELASMFISGSNEAMGSISQSFYENNKIRINNYWFCRTGEIVNSDHPSGTIVALGICGFVIPFVEWDDFKLLNINSEKESNGYNNHIEEENSIAEMIDENLYEEEKEEYYNENKVASVSQVKQNKEDEVIVEQEDSKGGGFHFEPIEETEISGQGFHFEPLD